MSRTILSFKSSQISCSHNIGFWFLLVGIFWSKPIRTRTYPFVFFYFLCGCSTCLVPWKAKETEEKTQFPISKNILSIKSSKISFSHNMILAFACRKCSDCSKKQVHWPQQRSAKLGPNSGESLYLVPCYLRLQQSCDSLVRFLNFNPNISLKPYVCLLGF